MDVVKGSFSIWVLCMYILAYMQYMKICAVSIYVCIVFRRVMTVCEYGGWINARLILGIYISVCISKVHTCNNICAFNHKMYVLVFRLLGFMNLWNVECMYMMCVSYSDLCDYTILERV